MVRKRRKEISMFKIILILFLVWLLFFMGFSIYGVWKDPVSFGIYFPEGQNITKGEDLIITYKVSNHWPKEIRSLNLTYWVEDKSGNIRIKEKTINMDENPKWFSPFEGEIKQSTGLLFYNNEYKFFANMAYIDTHNNINSKGVSLSFKIE